MMIMKMIRTGSLMLLILTATACVGSHRLTTPPLYLQDAGILYCTAVNLHDMPVTLDINVYDQNGNNRCGAGPWTLDPGHTVYQVCNSDLHIDIDPVRYCIFTYDGERGKIVGSAQIDPPEGEAIPALAVP